MKKPSKLLSALTSLLLAVTVLTGAVAVPILWRGFYYLQINALDLTARTGFSAETIRGAFDEVMNYLVWGAEFGTGQLPYSAEGFAHFADCQFLFRLDFIALGVSLLAVVVILGLCHSKKLRLHRFLGHGVAFWTFAGLTTCLVVLGIWAAVDFPSLFTAFHHIAFPNKENWLFNAATDPIILILPEAFWLRAAALVGGLTVGISGLLALAEHILLPRQAPTVFEELTELPR